MRPIICLWSIIPGIETSLISHNTTAIQTNPSQLNRVMHGKLRINRGGNRETNGPVTPAIYWTITIAWTIKRTTSGIVITTVGQSQVWMLPTISSWNRNSWVNRRCDWTLNPVTCDSPSHQRVYLLWCLYLSLCFFFSIVGKNSMFRRKTFNVLVPVSER